MDHNIFRVTLLVSVWWCQLVKSIRNSKEVEGCEKLEKKWVKENIKIEDEGQEKQSRIIEFKCFIESGLEIRK
jgi:hypothetical protein